MLKTIDPLLNADVLYALRAMGHGDELVVADTNFPANSIARQTAARQAAPHRQRQRGAGDARPCCRVLPLDTFVDDAAIRMEIIGSPHEVPPVQHEVQAEIDHAEGSSSAAGLASNAIAFYEKAKDGLCVIVTGERRFYGCFLFTKGVIPPDGE